MMNMKKLKINSNGQHMKANFFCVNCHRVGSHETHYPNCDNHECYAIPSIAEVPRKNASRKKWEEFKNSYVYIEPVGFWFYSSSSWYYKKYLREG